MAAHPRIMGQPVYNLKHRHGHWPYIYLDGRRVNVAGWPGPGKTAFMLSDEHGPCTLAFGIVDPGPLGDPLVAFPTLLSESL